MTSRNTTKPSRHRNRWHPAMLIAFALGGLSACDQEKGQQVSLPEKDGGAPAMLKLERSDESHNANSPSGSSVAVHGRRFVGTVTPSASVKIPAKQTGTLAELMVDAGDFVHAGDVLFRQDTTLARLQLKQAEAALELTQIQARAATRELGRAQKLASGGATASARLDGAQTQSLVAHASVDQAQASIALAKQQIREATMTAPMDGIITKKLMERGELATMMPPSVVFVLEAHNPIRIDVSVPIQILPHLKEGQAATIRVRELNLERSGKIKRVSDEVDPRTRSAQLILEVDNQDRSLKPGMYVDVELSSPNKDERTAADAAPPAKGSN